jgi:hypothetical protein
MASMKRKKISSTLERAARGVRDSDEFVGHIGSIAERYRREHALETGPRGKDVRRALKVFRKHATGLAGWFEQAQTKQSSLEYEALAKIGAVMHSAPNQTLASSASILSWLEQAERAAQVAEAQLSKKSALNASRISIEALRATFEHHGLKWSTQLTKTTTSDAISLLCAIAKSAGDVSMTPQQARAAMLAGRPTK